MKKKKFKQEEDNQDWLVSYADMMTLIACFFILMMAFANYDPVGFNIKAQELSKYFRKDKYKSSELNLKEIREEITKHDSLKKQTKISLKDGELIVSFSSDLLYADGETGLSKTMRETLDSLIEIIKVQLPDGRILIEGHADDSKKEEQWELSLKRTAEVAKRFEYFGFHPEFISAIARSNSKPLVQSSDAKGVWSKEKAQINRRTVIRVLTHREEKAVKFGFGIYFKDATEDQKRDLEAKDLEGFEINQVPKN